MIPILQLVYALLNVLILVLVLFLALRKPVSKFLEARHDEFIKRSKEAEKSYSEAKGKLETMKTKLNNIDEEGRCFIEAARRKATLDADKARDEALRLSKLVINDAERLAGTEMSSARNRLKAGLIASVMSDAKTKIESSVNDTGRNRYIDEYSAAVKKEVLGE